MGNNRIIEITLDERTVVRRSPDVEHERKIAIYDLLQKNYFSPISGLKGPYYLQLGMKQGDIVFWLRDQEGKDVGQIVLPLAPLQYIIRDYFIISDSYYYAIKNSTSSRIESIDLGRRGLHNEAAELLKETLSDSASIDVDTARRLFTLICVLQIKA